MTFTLEIQMGSAEMRSPADIVHALQKVAGKIANHQDLDRGAILDTNGKRCGEWAFRGSP